MIEGSVQDAQIPLINVHADVSSGGGRLMFGVSLHLHLYMYICERLCLLADAISTKISCTCPSA